MSYFISGLPRSRTAWLSVFMSQSGIFCHHDGFNGCSTMEDYLLKIKNCGDSSTGLMLIDINKIFPESKTVIIEKSDLEMKKCIKWIDETYNANSKMQVMDLQKKQNKIKGLRINQSEIDDNLKLIWEYLVDAKWDDKYSILSSFNIQSDPFAIDFNAARKLIESL
jgi:hypothetical protein